MKKLLFGAISLCTSSGFAMAQSGVTVYGVMDLGIVFESGGAGGSSANLESGVQSGSRLGFKGTEDLGGGLFANFVIEAGILADTGTSAQGGLAFGRQTLVGLSGGFGSLKLGRQFNLISNAIVAIDPFSGGNEGTYANIMTFSSRTSNGIYYTTPIVGGFTGDIAYGFGETSGDSAKNREIGLSLSFANGPAYAVIAQRNLNNSTATNTNKITILGGKYNFGRVTAALGYGINKDSVNIDSSDLLIGVLIPIETSTFLASYMHHNDKSALHQDAKQFAVGYTYAMSKRTNLYTSYAILNNKNNAGLTVGNATEFGTGDRGFAVGIRHKF